ncbi:MAG: FtsH protease activity modulator HflK [Dehalococcoidia bacterium]
MYGERRPEFDPDQFMKNLREGWDNFKSKLPGDGNIGALIIGGIVVLLLIWLATGFYIVGPGERAAVRLFGQFRGIEEQGLKWYFPAPVGARDIVNVEVLRTMQVGFREEPQFRPVEVEAQMITGDLGLVTIEMVVQYRVAEVENFLFNVSDPGDPDRDIPPGRPDGRTLRDATEAALRQVVGQRGIDDALTIARAAVEADTLVLLQELMMDYETGLQILNVQLLNVEPPAPVAPAFSDVVNARLNRQSRINEAQAYEQDRLPRAQGAAAQVVEIGQGFREARIAQARGEAAQFTAIWQEYQASPNVTRQRLFLETMERVLPGLHIYVLDGQGGNGVLPFLPLAPINGQGSPPPPPPANGGGNGGTE